MSDGIFHSHKLPPHLAQNQYCNENNGYSHDGTQQTHDCAHLSYGAVYIRFAVTNHKCPAPVFQIFVNGKLLHAVFVFIGICTGLGAAVLLNPADDLLIAGVFRLGIQQFFVRMIKVHSGLHVQEYIFTVWQTHNIQIQQRIHQMAGIYSGSHIADALLPVKDGIVHGQDHAPGSRGFHNPQIGQLLLCQDGITEGFQRIAFPCRNPDGAL